MHVTNGTSHHKWIKIAVIHFTQGQGCPLSPSLFAISYFRIEKSLEFRQKIQQISVYVDGIPLYLQNPSTSLLQTISLRNSFSDISGYTINWSKSTILSLNPSGWDVTTQTAPVTLNTGNIEYLGINISPKLSVS